MKTLKGKKKDLLRCVKRVGEIAFVKETDKRAGMKREIGDTKMLQTCEIV